MTTPVCFIPCAPPREYEFPTLYEFATLQSLVVHRMNNWDFEHQFQPIFNQWVKELKSRKYNPEVDFIGQFSKMPPTGNALLLLAAREYVGKAGIIRIAYHLPASDMAEREAGYVHENVCIGNRPERTHV